MTRSRQDGFGLIGIAVIILAVGLLAFIAYRVWDARTNTTQTDEAATSQQQTADQQEITTDAELQQADTELEQTDIEGSDLSELEAQTNY